MGGWVLRRRWTRENNRSGEAFNALAQMAHDTFLACNENSSNIDNVPSIEYTDFLQYALERENEIREKYSTQRFIKTFCRDADITKRKQRPNGEVYSDGRPLMFSSEFNKLQQHEFSTGSKTIWNNFKNFKNDKYGNFVLPPDNSIVSEIEQREHEKREEEKRLKQVELQKQQLKDQKSIVHKPPTQKQGAGLAPPPGQMNLKRAGIV